MKTHKFARKPFYVDAVRVSEANISEVAEWCGGVLMEEDGAPYIKVTVHRPLTDRQTMAFLGDWILESGNGFKVYTPKAFDKSFEKVKTLTKEQADLAGIKVPHEPRPKGEKKRPVPTAPKSKRQLTHNVGAAIREAQEAVKPDVDYRDAKTGQYVSEETAEASPDTTVAEVEKPKKSKADVEAERLIAEIDAIRES